MLRTKPTAPRLLKATFPAHLKTLVTWYAPLSTGGSAITSYYVRWSINGRTWTTWARTGVLKYAYKLGLPAGRRAYVEVMAYNVAGFSPIAILGFIPTR